MRDEKHDHAVLAQLRDRIYTGHYAPGQSLPQVKIATELQISRTPLREAFRMLEREGLVIARQGRGTFVASTLAPASLRHHDELRAELERWLRAALAAGLDEESIRALISATLRESLARRVA